VLVPAFAWAAGTPERVQVNPHDQRIATQSVLSKSDLIGPTFWKQAPSGSSDTADSLKGCETASNLSRYVITGNAKRKYTTKKTTGQLVASGVTVFRTLAMAQADWAATISYKKLSCVLRRAIRSDWKAVSFNRLPLHAGNRTVAARIRFVVFAKGARVPAALDFIVFAVGRCNEVFVYGYIDNGTPILKELAPFEQQLVEGIVQVSTRAGCLLPGPTTGTTTQSTTTAATTTTTTTTTTGK
jgi:hypothetical protein